MTKFDILDLSQKTIIENSFIEDKTKAELIADMKFVRTVINTVNDCTDTDKVNAIKKLFY